MSSVYEDILNAFIYIGNERKSKEVVKMAQELLKNRKLDSANGVCNDNTKTSLTKEEAEWLDEYMTTDEKGDEKE